jgi:hypothetical protein
MEGDSTPAGCRLSGVLRRSGVPLPWPQLTNAKGPILPNRVRLGSPVTLVQAEGWQALDSDNVLCMRTVCMIMFEKRRPISLHCTFQMRAARKQEST